MAEQADTQAAVAQEVQVVQTLLVPVVLHRPTVAVPVVVAQDLEILFLI